ncbi:MAG: ABC transporter permease subunit [Eubacteriales bacterium]|nr:ABC transporter permease subunit [Eubacteriales bacterium]
MQYKKKPFFRIVRDNRVLLLMLLPAIAFTLLFSYVPMGGIVLAFKNYRYADGMWGSPWIGLTNFKFLFLSGKLWPITRNTLLYNAVFIVTGMVFQIGFAIILSEVSGRFFKKFAQSAMFLPHFISWVVVAAIAYNVLNYEKGVINNLITSLGGDPVNVYNNPGLWPYILVFLKTWKGVGYGSVVYLAAITGMDQEMFEAAEIDGANVWQKIFRIILPLLVPTIVIMLLLSLGQIFRGDFGLFYQLVGNNQKLLPSTDIIDTFVFRALMSSSDIGMASASGLYQSVVCFVTIVLCNLLVKKIEPDYALY